MSTPKEAIDWELGELAKSEAWLLGEIKELRRQLGKLEAERCRLALRVIQLNHAKRELEASE